MKNSLDFCALFSVLGKIPNCKYLHIDAFDNIKTIYGI